MEDRWCIARSEELDVISQGRSAEEAQENLAEAVALYIESFGLDQEGNAPDTNKTAPALFSEGRR